MDRQTERRRSFVIPRRGFIQRHPKLVIYSATTIGLLIFFSRPIYDIFRKPVGPPLPPEKRRETILKQWKV